MYIYIKIFNIIKWCQTPGDTIPADACTYRGGNEKSIIYKSLVILLSNI